MTDRRYTNPRTGEVEPDLQVEGTFAEVVASIQECVSVRINHGVG